MKTGTKVCVYFVTAGGISHFRPFGCDFGNFRLNPTKQSLYPLALVQLELLRPHATMPRSPPPSDRHWTPRYSRERDRRPYREYDDYEYADRRDRDDYDRRGGRPPPQGYRGRREYPSPPPGRRDRSWDRDRDRDREFVRDREREYDRDHPRKRSRSPSPRSARRYTPPHDERRYARASRYEYPSYDRREPSPRGQGLVYPPAETTPPPRESPVAVDVKRASEENAEYSEEEGMVTPPQVKKRKLEEEAEKGESSSVPRGPWPTSSQSLNHQLSRRHASSSPLPNEEWNPHPTRANPIQPSPNPTRPTRHPAPAAAHRSKSPSPHSHTAPKRNRAPPTPR